MNFLKFKYLRCLLGMMCLITLGCGGSVIKHDPTNSSLLTEITENTYRLGPNDSISIQVFDEADLLTQTTVSGHGTIKFSLLGEIPVAGMTVKEVEEDLAQRLEAGYLKNPKVTVSIREYRNYYVTGEAKNPGAFPFQEGMTVLKAITRAGGWTTRAVKDEAKILRIINGEEQELQVGMEDSVHPDDIIMVPESFF